MILYIYREIHWGTSWWSPVVEFLTIFRAGDMRPWTKWTKKEVEQECLRLGALETDSNSVNRGRTDV